MHMLHARQTGLLFRGGFMFWWQARHAPSQIRGAYVVHSFVPAMRQFFAGQNDWDCFADFFPPFRALQNDNLISAPSSVEQFFHHQLSTGPFQTTRWNPNFAPICRANLCVRCSLVCVLCFFSQRGCANAMRCRLYISNVTNTDPLSFANDKTSFGLFANTHVWPNFMKMVLLLALRYACACSVPSLHNSNCCANVKGRYFSPNFRTLIQPVFFSKVHLAISHAWTFAIVELTVWFSYFSETFCHPHGRCERLLFPFRHVTHQQKIHHNEIQEQHSRWPVVGQEAQIAMYIEMMVLEFLNDNSGFVSVRDCVGLLYEPCHLSYFRQHRPTQPNFLDNEQCNHNMIFDVSFPQRTRHALGCVDGGLRCFAGRQPKSPANRRNNHHVYRAPMRRLSANQHAEDQSPTIGGPRCWIDVSPTVAIVERDQN